MRIQFFMGILTFASKYFFFCGIKNIENYTYYEAYEL